MRLILAQLLLEFHFELCEETREWNKNQKKMFLVGAAASEASFEEERCLNTLSLSILEREANLNDFELHGFFSSPQCVIQAYINIEASIQLRRKFL